MARTRKILQVPIIVILGFCLGFSKSLRFDLKSGHTKCIAEEINTNAMSVGNYHVVNPNQGYPLPNSHKLTVRVTSFDGNSYHSSDGVESGQFAFTATVGGDYVACFWPAVHFPVVNVSVDFDWKSGVEATNWGDVIKKGSLDVMEIELKKLMYTVKSIHDEMFYRKDRELEMHALRETTNSSMFWLSFFSVCTCLSVAGLQVWHLKNFFKKKKLI